MSRRLSLTETGRTLYDRALSISRTWPRPKRSHPRPRCNRADGCGQRAVEFWNSPSGAAYRASARYRILSWISAWCRSSISSKRATISLSAFTRRITGPCQPQARDDVPCDLRVARLCRASRHAAAREDPGALHLLRHTFGFVDSGGCWTMPARGIPSRCARSPASCGGSARRRWRALALSGSRLS